MATILSFGMGASPRSSPASRRRTEVVHLAGGIVAPGFVDVQVNGGGGILLNDDPSAEGLCRIAVAHRSFGTTGVLPTLITDTRERILVAIDAVAEADDPGVVGLHLEESHLDPARKGAHPALLMRLLDDDDVALYIRARRPLGLLMVTLAPAQATPEAVRRLTAAGVVVSLGYGVFRRGRDSKMGSACSHSSQL